MPETKSISDCSDIRLHSRRIPFRGNSDRWTLKMQRVQIINPHYLVFCLKKNDSSSKTRKEVKLSINHSGYLNSSYTFT